MNGKSWISASVPLTIKGRKKFKFSALLNLNKSTEITKENLKLIVSTKRLNWAELTRCELKYQFVNKNTLLSRSIQLIHDDCIQFLSYCVIRPETFLCWETNLIFFKFVKQWMTLLNDRNFNVEALRMLWTLSDCSKRL